MLEYFGTCFYSLIMLFSQCLPNRICIYKQCKLFDKMLLVRLVTTPQMSQAEIISVLKNFSEHREVPNKRVLVITSLTLQIKTMVTNCYYLIADCERSFSDMNRIKSAERSRLKDILNSLMRIYSLRGNEGEFRDILKKDLEKVSKKVAYKLWK